MKIQGTLGRFDTPLLNVMKNVHPQTLPANSILRSSIHRSNAISAYGKLTKLSFETKSYPGGFLDQKELMN
jgi:hypothetical protein